MANKLTHESSKRDSRSQASKEDEKEGSHTLGIDTILYVTEVEGIATLDVIDHPAKWAASSGERVAVGVNLERGQNS